MEVQTPFQLKELNDVDAWKVEMKKEMVAIREEMTMMWKSMKNLKEDMARYMKITAKATAKLEELNQKNKVG